MQYDENRLWRSQTYALLANLLAGPPSDDLLRNIAALKVEDTDSGLGDGWQALIDAATMTEPNALQREYQQLFIGLTQGEVVPYGSYYLTGFLNEKPLAELRADLSKLGLTRQQDKKEPEDHVAAQCDVMRLILSANGEPLVNDQQFFNQHLAEWLEKFFVDLQKASSATFYRAVGQLGERFSQSEKRLLQTNE